MHSMPNFAVLKGESRQTTTSSHVRVRHPWETCSFTSFSASVSTLNQQIFTYFVQRRSFLSSYYHFNLKQAFKVNNSVPMTMQHGRCHCSRAIWQVSGRACSCKKDPCFLAHSMEEFLPCFPTVRGRITWRDIVCMCGSSTVVFVLPLRQMKLLQL